MANTISNILPKILARGLLALREQAIMPRIVNGDYSAEAAEKGDTIDVPIPSETSAYSITAAPTHSSAPDSAPSKVQISLNQWKGAGFYLTDKEMVEIDRNRHYIPLQMSEALRALANAANEHIHANYSGIYGYTGTAGTTPFAYASAAVGVSPVSPATNLRKVLHSQRAPRDNRRGVLDFDAEAQALGLQAFSDAEKVGSAVVKIQGEIGRKFGLDWYTDDAVQTHTAGTLSTPGAVVGSTTAAGATSVDVKSASTSGHIKIGDVFTFAGHTQTYVATNEVSAVVSGTAQAVNIQPPLAQIVTAAAAVTFKASHVVNLGFHRDALAFANRPLGAATATNPRMLSMTDPVTGITLRLELTRQYKQDRWELDLLWGSKLVRAALAARLAG
jgi:hypothetical protein